MKKFTGSLVALALFTTLSIFSAPNAFAEDKTMCGAFGHDEEDFTHPEKSWIEVPGRGTVTLEFSGRTPMLSEGLNYCCFGDFNSSRKVLRVRTGCEQQ